MSNQTNQQICDFFKVPILVGDYVAECYQSGIRIGKVLKVNESSLTLSCQRKTGTWKNPKTSYVASGGHTDIDEAIQHIKQDHNAQRYLRIYTWNKGTMHYVINLTALNLLSDEIIENRV